MFIFQKKKKMKNRKRNFPKPSGLNSIPKNSRQNMINKVKAYFDLVPRKWADTYLYDKENKKVRFQNYYEKLDLMTNEQVEELVTEYPEIINE